MNRRTWKEFITKRSTIWTLSLCLVGVIVLGGIAAVDSSRDGKGTQSETELDQIAYLEEELEIADNEDSSISTDEEHDLEEVSGGNDAAAGLDTDGTAADTDSTSDSVTTPGADGTIGSDTGSDTDNIANGSTTSSTDNTVSDGTVSNTDDNTAAADTASGSDSTSDGSAASDTENSDTDTSSDAEEASSAGIISEQTLIDAGVSFTNEQSLLWPSAGTVVIDYSMDKSVYFETLNQYKYNPALIISSDTGNQVLASAKGIVESISIDEETGTTLVLNIGNGYKLTYGQLMEAAVSEGDVVEAGDLLAYISEPTKYYSTEGSNLYFAMTKDGEPVDPVLYLE